MMCPQCSIERNKEKDFLGKEICYKCQYQKKLKNPKIKKKCRICSGSLPKNKWVYCKWECADIGMREQKKNWKVT